MEEGKEYGQIPKKAAVWEETAFGSWILEDGVLEDQTFLECEFHRCQFLTSQIRRCLFRSCKFYNCVFVGNEWDFSSMISGGFYSCVCVGINWEQLRTKTRANETVGEAQNTFFKYCSFFQMNLNKFHFETCRFQESYFEECRLRESCFEQVEFDKTQFRSCDLRKADFRGAVNYVMDPTQNRMQDARFSFPEVIHLLDGLGIRIE